MTVDFKNDEKRAWSFWDGWARCDCYFKMNKVPYTVEEMDALARIEWDRALRRRPGAPALASQAGYVENDAKQAFQFPVS